MTIQVEDHIVGAHPAMWSHNFNLVIFKVYFEYHSCKGSAIYRLVVEKRETFK